MIWSSLGVQGMKNHDVCVCVSKVFWHKAWRPLRWSTLGQHPLICYLWKFSFYEVLWGYAAWSHVLFIFHGASRNIVLTKILKNSLQLRKTPRPQILRPDQWLCQTMATGILMSMQNRWRKVSKKRRNLGLFTQISLDSKTVHSRTHLLFFEELFFTSHYTLAVSIGHNPAAIEQKRSRYLVNDSVWIIPTWFFWTKH